jgi:hypothetical protein
MSWKDIPGDVCPICRIAAGCPHLLLAIDVDAQEAFEGILFEQRTLLEDRFSELFAQVRTRQAICGDGLVRAATRAYFSGYGEIAGTNEYHAELDRDYVHEYLMDILDRAPNLFRTRLGKSDSLIDYIWSDMPDAAVALVRDRLQELQRLIDLPNENSEWIPQDLRDYHI